MTKWGRKTISSSNSNVFSKLWLSRFKNSKKSEEYEHELEYFGRMKANKMSALNQYSDERDVGDESLCGSDHKLNVSPVGYDIEDPKMVIKSKDDQNKRKSVHLRRKLHGGKVEGYSPRTVSTKAACKIRAFEDLKKPMMKTKEGVTEDAFRAGVDSFAIVKTSFDPEKDFRESMVEMIMEKRISEPEELEELLACYLTLNCDVYHDLIVKVFRQVWFELKHLHFDEQLMF